MLTVCYSGASAPASRRGHAAAAHSGMHMEEVEEIDDLEDDMSTLGATPRAPPSAAQAGRDSARPARSAAAQGRGRLKRMAVDDGDAGVWVPEQVRTEQLSKKCLFQCV